MTHLVGMATFAIFMGAAGAALMDPWALFLRRASGRTTLDYALLGRGWGEAKPAWWLNLEAIPVATFDAPDGTRTVRARAASGDERDRLWATFRDYPGWGADLGALTARRPGETAIVVLEPTSEVH